MERRTSLIASLLLAIVFLPSLGALADGANLQTDSTEYSAGDAVTFSGGGYVPGNSYKINISLMVDGDPVLVVEAIPFVADESGNVPSDPPVSWVIPFDAENGTYVANATDVTDPEAEVFMATCSFEVASGLGDRLGAFAGDLEGLEGEISSLAEEVQERLLASLSNCIRKVEAAVSLLEGGNENAARNQLRAARNMLTAFLHKVWAASGKTIDLDTAEVLNGTAFSYIAYIDSLIPEMIPVGKQLALNVARTLQRQRTNLITFALRKSLSEVEAEGGDIELGIQGMLDEAEGKRKKLMGLFEQGEITNQDLIMELLGDVDLEATTAKELAEEIIAALGETKGKRFGQYIQMAKELKQSIGTDGTEVQSSNGQGSVEGGDGGNGNGNGNGNGQGHGQGKGQGHGQGQGQGHGNGQQKGKGNPK